MDRAGLTEQQQQNIFEAFKKLYRQGGALLENAKALASQEGIDENVQAIVDSITRSSEHQFGRYLETFRH
jgi:acyl-[acyl carrier protein]--UDP-N-acetylglucosamine O-acyltransferase